MATEVKNTWSTDRLRLALKRRFAPPEYALLEEVRNGTGFQQTTRYADALVMSLYPSRGLVLTGFEIKQSRSDWVNELKQPDKAESIARYCDQWALVVTTPDLLKPGELPAAWGLLAPAKEEWTEGGKLRWVKEPSALSPQPVSRLFLASLFRAIQQQEEASLSHKLADRLELVRREAQEAANERVEQATSRVKSELERLREGVRSFEKETGVRIGQDAWSNSALAARLKQANAVRSLGDLQHEFERVARQAEVIARSARQAQTGCNDDGGAEWVI